jgi:hypothetical protein
MGRKIGFGMPMKEPRTWLGLRARAWLGAVAAVALSVWLTWFLINLGPKKVDIAQLPVALNGPQSRIDREIDAVEQRYRKLPADAVPPLGMESELTRAIERQERLLAANPKAGQEQTQRLERLHVARDTVLAQKMWGQVETLEAALQADSSARERIVQLEELLKLRQEINRSRATAQFKDLVRETQLERELEGLQAGPLREAVDAMTAQAQAAFAEKNWPAALDYYTRAREMLDDLNRRFARSRYADMALANRLKAEEQALQGAGESAEIEVYVQGGDAAAADRPEVAAEYYHRALGLQTLLNQRWRKSRFFSTSRLDELEAKRQTVLAEALLVRMRALDGSLDEALAARQLLAAGKSLAEAQSIAQRLKDEFPRNRGNDEGLSRKFSYLASLGGGMRALQDTVYDQLVPLAGHEDQMLMRAEVSQELYTAVMKFNPSLEVKPGQAVAFVSWEDAREFCRRLGWILGQPVRLPSQEVMRSALNERGAVDPASREIVSAYTQLEGGVSEWLEDTPNDTEAEILLGSGASGNSGSLFATRRKDTRSREVGFRVMVGPESVRPSDSVR